MNKSIHFEKKKTYCLEHLNGKCIHIYIFSKKIKCMVFTPIINDYKSVVLY